MERNQANLLQGTLHPLIVKAIGDAKFHGLGIARRVEQITEGTFKVRPGSLFSESKPNNGRLSPVLSVAR